MYEGEAIIMLGSAGIALLIGSLCAWREPDCRWDKSLIGTIMGCSLIVGLGFSLFLLFIYWNLYNSGLVDWTALFGWTVMH